jgi:pyruvate dehydrogenase E1 component
MAMVVRANRRIRGIGGHISTFASAATLYEVGFNHFFRGRKRRRRRPDLLPGARGPGIYARAFLEGRMTEEAPAQLPARAGRAAGCRPIRIRG